MNTYEEKKEKRIQRYEDLSKSHAVMASDRMNSHNIKTLRGMAGEPVKIGHHSEKRHRGLIQKADNDMRKSVEHSDKSAYYADRAEAARNNKSISSDDPEAIPKLEAKLKGLEEVHAAMKKANAEARKTGEPKPHPAYQLQNSNANIRNVKKRLERLRKAADDVSQDLFAVEGCRVFDNVEENRLQLFFDDKPDYEMRSKLKSSGFRWSRNNMAWQRQRFRSAVWSAKHILGYA